jgi:DnaJ-class molecular chaperone
VLPSAEDFLIRAVYKAMAMRYHPDKFAGSAEEANRRMAEINEAYEVLSSAEKRKEYDRERSSSQSQNSGLDEGDNSEARGFDPIAADWKIAVKYCLGLE